MLSFHLSKKAKLTIAVRPWKDLSRVDPVKVDESSKVISFGEKNIPPESDGFWLINGGVYVVERDVVEELPLKRLSWEAAVIPKLVENGVVYAYKSNGYFIDIGVPEDYFRAQKEIPEILRF
jgi:D-glycero-alpha-D-manno-heptose 1-phosphate guanylyltransferase